MIYFDIFSFSALPRARHGSPKVLFNGEFGAYCSVRGHGQEHQRRRRYHGAALVRQGILWKCIYITFVLYFNPIFSYEKACLYELEYEQKICDDLSSHDEESNAVQRVVNDFNRNKLLLDNIIFLFVCLFVGTFSGKFGFRITIILSLTSKVSNAF